MSDTLPTQELVELMAKALWEYEGWDNPSGGKTEAGGRLKLSWDEARERKHYAVATTYGRAEAALASLLTAQAADQWRDIAAERP